MLTKRPLTALTNLIVFAILAICLFFAEHHSPTDVLDGSNRDFVLAERQGQAQRQAAYLIIGFVGLLLLFRSDRKSLHWRTMATATFAMLIGWSALSIFWADEPLVSLKRFSVLLLMTLGALGVVKTWSSNAIIQFIAISSALHVSVGVLAEISLGVFTPFNSDYRFAGTLHWNEQGFLCMVLVLSGLISAQVSSRYSVAFRLLGAYGFLLLLLTKSRGSLVGLVVGLISYWGFTLSNTRKFRLLMVAGISLLILLMADLSGSVYQFLSRGGEGVENFTGRVPLWQDLLIYAKERPVEGFGYEDFWTAPRIDYISDEEHWNIDSAHSGYLEGALTVGLVGMSLHVLVLIMFFSRGIYAYLRTKQVIFAFGAGLCAIYLIVGWLESILIIKASAVSFYFMATLLAIAFADLQHIAGAGGAESAPVLASLVHPHK